MTVFGVEIESVLNDVAHKYFGRSHCYARLI